MIHVKFLIRCGLRNGRDLSWISVTRNGILLTTDPDNDFEIEDGDVIRFQTPTNELPTVEKLIETYKQNKEEALRQLMQGSWKVRHTFCCVTNKDHTLEGDRINFEDFKKLAIAKGHKYLRSAIASGKLSADINRCLAVALNESPIFEKIVKVLLSNGAIAQRGDYDLSGLSSTLLTRLFETSPLQRQRYVQIVVNAVSFGLASTVKKIAPCLYQYLPTDIKQHQFFVKAIAETSLWPKIFRHIAIPQRDRCTNTTDIETLEEIDDDEAVVINRHLFSRTFLNKFVNQGKSEVFNPFTNIEFSRYELLQMLKQGVAVPMRYLDV